MVAVWLHMADVGTYGCPQNKVFSRVTDATKCRTHHVAATGVLILLTAVGGAIAVHADHNSPTMVRCEQRNANSICVSAVGNAFTSVIMN